jgi:hypothetical protein
VSSDITPEFIEAVSQETGVPEWLLTQGGNTTTEGVWARARQAVAWKRGTAPTPPRPQTAAVSPESPPTRVPTPQSAMAGNDDWRRAWRLGNLGPAGIPAPPPRRTGEAHRNAGPR